MSRTVVLVSCVKTKQTDGQAHAAADLYTSPWFKGARQYAERVGDAWFILSAEHGLVEPGQQLQAYDTWMATMKKPARMAWSALVLEQLASRLQPGDRIIILAGVKYREYLVAPLRANGNLVDIPMAGLELGEQKAWLNAANAAPAAANPTPPSIASSTTVVEQGQFSPVAYVSLEQPGDDAEARESRICPVSYTAATVSVRISPRVTIQFGRPAAGRDFGIYRRTWSAPSSKTSMVVYVPVLSPPPAYPVPGAAA